MNNWKSKGKKVNSFIKAEDKKLNTSLENENHKNNIWLAVTTFWHELVYGNDSDIENVKLII